MEIAILYKSKMETKYIDEEKYSKAQNRANIKAGAYKTSCRFCSTLKLNSKVQKEAPNSQGKYRQKLQREALYHHTHQMRLSKAQQTRSRYRRLYQAEEAEEYNL